MYLNRVAGVRVPEGQSTEQAPTMTVTNFCRLEVGLVEYGDDRGRKVTSIVFIAGDKAFIPPQGEYWTSGFRSFVKQLNDQIIQRNEVARALELQKVSLAMPTKDSVDVLESESPCFSSDTNLSFSVAKADLSSDDSQKSSESQG